MWRVEKSLAPNGRYYVVKGYEANYRWSIMWTNSFGAGDFITIESAQSIANTLNNI